MSVHNAVPIQLSISKKYIWPSGELGKVTIKQEKDIGVVDIQEIRVIDMTFEQAKTLLNQLRIKLGEENGG